MFIKSPILYNILAPVVVAMLKMSTLHLVEMKGEQIERLQTRQDLNPIYEPQAYCSWVGSSQQDNYTGANPRRERGEEDAKRGDRIQQVPPQPYPTSLTTFPPVPTPSPPHLTCIPALPPLASVDSSSDSLGLLLSLHSVGSHFLVAKVSSAVEKHCVEQPKPA